MIYYFHYKYFILIEHNIINMSSIIYYIFDTICLLFDIRVYLHIRLYHKNNNT